MSSKLREALEVIAEICDGKDIGGLDRIVGIYNIAKAALYAPPRNCDRFSNNEQAWDAYCEYMSDGNILFLDYEDWLFAEAKGKTK